MKSKWQCPSCKAGYQTHGGGERCAATKQPAPFSGICDGLCCECERPADDEHGEVDTNPCENAQCFHCGWTGTLPQPKYKFKGWAKKAWDAGWRPPKGWDPPPELVKA